jgi:hypothetical protein
MDLRFANISAGSIPSGTEAQEPDYMFTARKPPELLAKIPGGAGKN